MLWWFRTLFLHGWNHPFSNVCQSCSIYSSGCVFSHITVNMKLLSENLSVPIVLNFKHSLFDPILMVRIFEMGTILQSHMPNWQSIGHGRVGTILYKKMTHTHTIEQCSKFLNPLYWINYRESATLALGSVNIPSATDATMLPCYRLQGPLFRPWPNLSHWSSSALWRWQNRLLWSLRPGVRLEKTLVIGSVISIPQQRA